MKINIKKIATVVGISAIAVGGTVVALQPVAVNTTTVVKTDINSQITAKGKVMGEECLTIYAPVSGKLIKAEGKKGDEIKAGMQLAVYDTVPFENMYSSVLAGEDGAREVYEALLADNVKYQGRYNEEAAKNREYQANYDDVTGRFNELQKNVYSDGKQIRDDNRRIQEQIYNLEQQIQSKTNEITENELKVRLAQYQGSDWSMKYLEDQQERLNQELLGMNQQLVDLQKQLLYLPEDAMTVDQNAEYLSLAQELENILRDWAYTRTKMETADARIISESVIAQQKNQITVASNDLAMAERDLGFAKTGVVASYDGIIIEKYVNDGASVEAGMELYSIQTTDSYKVDINVSKFDIAALEIGQKAVITIGNKDYEGEVTKINKVASTDASGKAKVSVEVTFKNPDDNLIVGIEANVVINTQSKSNTAAVATQVVYTDDGGNYVYTVETGKINKKYIETGIKDKNYTEVVSGLSNGEHIVTEIINDEKIGRKVRENYTE